MTTKNKNRHFKNQFRFIFDIVKLSKFKLIILAVLAVIALLTGIIVAIKTSSYYNASFNFFEFGFSFWGRLLSMLLIAIICFCCGFSKWLFPIALLMLAYRAYLLGLYLTLIIIANDFVGVVIGILVVLPCQLFALTVLTVMHVLLLRLNKDENCCGGGDKTKQRVKVFVIAIIVLLVICLLESLLLSIFSPTVILIV
ncbi:MAG: hypothetical protein E7379_02150 [Clostridiales bacterium]|nr:hypothetical protein [Clostridiales bacterium]